MSSSSASEHQLDASMASRLAAIALGHVTREHPNVIAHAAPNSVHPIFYGSFDWHSCVHSYWLLATLTRLYPHLPEGGATRALFEDALTSAKIAGERATLEPASARGFERPYGWAWLLMLQAELLRHETTWAGTLQPLADLFVRRFSEHLPKATYPVRHGVHSNTAFALALVLEYAEEADDSLLAGLVRRTALNWYARDADCQAWEPSGEDFLSPSLIEAECMRRVLAPDAFLSWFRAFLPRIAAGEPAALLEPARVSDRSDGRIAHLDGLNLSRAWCWRSIAAMLPPDDPVRTIAEDTAKKHLAASMPHLAGDYMGEHWLASYALLALRPVTGEAVYGNRARRD
jgi:Protein of unknown function (DUF2891)